MPWVKIDDQMPQHPKLARVGALGLAMQVAAMCYCSRYLTDGILPEAALGTLLDLREFEQDGEDRSPEKVAEWLCNAGVWNKQRGGYVIHDYLAYNPSREQVTKRRQEVSQERSRAGSKGAAKRWQPHSNGVANE